MTSRKLDICVIIPFRNSSETLPLLLNALKDQSDPPDEILLIDNGSTDDSVKTVQGFQKGCPGLRLRMVCETEPGRTKAKNRGIQENTSSLIAFTDSDCIPDRDWIKNIRSFFRENPRMDAVGGIIRGYQPLTLAQKLKDEERAFVALSCRGIPVRMTDILTDRFMDTANMAIRKEALDGTCYDEAFVTGDDIELSAQLLKKGTAFEVCRSDILVLHSDKKRIADYLSMIYAYRIVYAQIIKKHLPGTLTIVLPLLKPFHRTFPVTVFIGQQPFIAVVLLLCAVFFPWILLISFTGYLAASSILIHHRTSSGLTFREAFLIACVRVLQKATSELGKVIGSIKYHLICL